MECAVTSFVDRLSRTELHALFDIGRPAYYHAGELLIREGEPGDFVVIVQSGQVKVTTHARLIGVRGTGELLGEMSCLDERPQPATILAHSPVRAVKIAAPRFREFLRRNPSVSVTVACQVIAQLRTAERRQGELASHEIAPRLVRTLTELVPVFQCSPGELAVEVPLSQHELAQLAGAADVSTQRALRLLRQRRLVQTGYGKVTIPCVPCLTGLAAFLAEGRKDVMKAILGCGGGDAHAHPA
jgi:CRP/FNR family cyclic AMP-dependent transcriptional regulator